MGYSPLVITEADVVYVITKANVTNYRNTTTTRY